MSHLGINKHRPIVDLKTLNNSFRIGYSFDQLIFFIRASQIQAVIWVVHFAVDKRKLSYNYLTMFQPRPLLRGPVIKPTSMGHDITSHMPCWHVVYLNYIFNLPCHFITHAGCHRLWCTPENSPLMCCNWNKVWSRVVNKSGVYPRRAGPRVQSAECWQPSPGEDVAKVD